MVVDSVACLVDRWMAELTNKRTGAWKIALSWAWSVGRLFGSLVSERALIDKLVDLKTEWKIYIIIDGMFQVGLFLLGFVCTL